MIYDIQLNDLRFPNRYLIVDLKRHLWLAIKSKFANLHSNLKS